MMGTVGLALVLPEGMPERVVRREFDHEFSHSDYVVSTRDMVVSRDEHFFSDDGSLRWVATAPVIAEVLSEPTPAGIDWPDDDTG